MYLRRSAQLQVVDAVDVAQLQPMGRARSFQPLGCSERLLRRFAGDERDLGALEWAALTVQSAQHGAQHEIAGVVAERGHADVRLNLSVQADELVEHLLDGRHG